MWDHIKKVLKAALALAKADPEDKNQIAELQAKVMSLTDELAAAKADTPSAEDKAEIVALLDEFDAATVTSEPEPTSEVPTEPAPQVEG